MWPWEHLAVGYLGYWILRRAFGGHTSGAGTFAAAVGSQFPDLVDKPLGLIYDVFASGYAAGHSVFMALPLSAAILAIGWRVSRWWTGVAFAVAYLLHLPADVAFFLLVDGEYHPSILLWPLGETTPAGEVDFVDLVAGFLAEFLTYLGTSTGLSYVVFEVLLLVIAFLAWRADGYPGVPGGSRGA